MKITDRVENIEGVEEAHWDGTHNRLAVYYLDTIPLDTIKVRVAGAIGDAHLQEALNEITLISVSV